MKHKIVIITDLIIFILVGLNIRFAFVAKIYTKFFDCSKITKSSASDGLYEPALYMPPSCIEMIHTFAMVVGFITVILAVIITALLFAIWAVRVKKV